MKYNDMTSHSILFGIMIFVVGVKTMSLVERIRDKTVKGNVRRLARVGAGEYSFIGYFGFVGMLWE